MENVIEVKNISVKYGTTTVLNNISFDVQKGEFCTIIGPNGAGKSTILKSIMKNIDIESGDILINHKSIKNISHKEKACMIGFVPQEYNISFNFNVYDIVAMGRNPYTKKFGKSQYDDKKIIQDALIKTSTFYLKDKNFNELSGGEKQRVIIARALAQQTSILVLDEATSNLDIHHQLDIIELIYSLNREDNLTVLTIMHDLNLSSRFSDKIVLLSDEGIVKIGTPDDIIDESVLRQVYDMEMLVRENKLLSCKEVVALRARRAKDDKNKNIHVICGGGTGEYIIQKLYSERYNVSCGVLNDGDSDLEICKNLSIRYVKELPFTSFSKESIEKNRELIKKSDIVILTDVAIGEGNFENIEILSYLDDKKIIILYNSKRDFVNGKCEEILGKIKSKKNVCVAMNLKELFNLVEEKN
ncbi:ATP-binding cassette domain-containing protein [Sedimentibacter sp. zth1]|uniref:ABC transporter ATP-binding protein n=1 Tax=Sedimentibacter sp. zth1 TaxID=2816908 RepID=UPI001A937CFA|nr:ATP-binding cassette domain-containing protein [Sedimentibacter sp. zth1]QSX06054.1 ATP-binding cassette domain-containing protein [Sedimentibacter sp. zth1]